MQLEIEEAALKKERDRSSKDRLNTLQKELADLKEKNKSMRARGKRRRRPSKGYRLSREEIEKIRYEIGVAERQYDLNRAAELKYGRLADLERQLKTEEEMLAPAAGR